MKINNITKNYPVIKMQGCGNDFVVLTDFTDSLTAIQVKNICSRHYGIGSDGLIAVLRSKNEGSIYRMKFYNPDGTVSEICGNGIRCFTKYLIDTGLTSNQNEITIETDAGIKKINVLSYTKMKAYLKVDMGIPSLYQPGQISLKPDNDGRVNGRLYEKDFTFVSMGNPHAVFFSEYPGEDVKKYGHQIENSTSMFPEKTNVEFVKVINKNEMIMHVWERGAGITLACGTGACASFVAGVLNGAVSGFATIHLPGGDLVISWEGVGKNLYMSGEAENICKIDAESIDEYLLS